MYLSWKILGTLLNGMTTPDSYRRVSDSNHVCCDRDLVEILGVEPSMPEATDLQSAAVTNAAQSPLPHLITLDV
jgi:hypothetical protein